MNEQFKYKNVIPAGGDTSTPLNLKKRLDLIQKYVKTVDERKIIDCGCGAGEYVSALSRLGADVWGIEYSESKVEKFKQGHEQLSDRVLSGNLENTPFEDSSFDVALLNEVLEHVPDDRQCLKEIYRILRPGGLLVLLSPSRLYPFETHGVYLKGSQTRVPHYIPFIPYIPVRMGSLIFDYWARNYWPGELRKMVNQCNFDIFHIDYLWQTFENISGNQPVLIRMSKPLLRRACAVLEAIPGIRAFGASQILVARKRYQIG